MKKKVFHFVSTNIISGLENMVINISTLVNGYDYIYVSPDGPINDYLSNLGIKHISIKKMSPFYVRKILQKYNPDVVHGHDVKASISLAFNHSICKNKNIKIISELHNDDPRMHKLSLRSGLYKISSSYYDKVVVVSTSVINNYIFRNSIQEKTKVIDNVINPLRIKDNVNKSNDVHNKWDCIFIGRLVTQKNPLSFVKIIYELKQYNRYISAIIVGDGELKKSVVNLIKEYNLTNNIKLVGFQYNPYQYLNDSKILVMPSIYEGFGLVALESLIVGTPVVASPVGGLKDILDKNCGEFAYSQSDFITKITDLLINNKLYYEKRKNTEVRSKKVNNIPKFIKKYNEVYNT